MAEAGLSLDPQSLFLLQTWTEAKSRLGMLYAAEENAMRALALDPENADTYLQLANIACYRKEWPKAESFYRKALRLSPRTKELRKAIGQCARFGSPLYQLLQGDQRSIVANLSLLVNVLIAFTCVYSLFFSTAKTAWTFAAYLVGPIFALCCLRYLCVPLTTLTLLLKTENRDVLDWKEKVCAQAVAGCLGVALVLAACSAWIHWKWFGPAGATSFLISVPLTGLLQPDLPPRAGRVAGAIVLLVLGVLTLLAVLITADVPALVLLLVNAFCTLVYGLTYTLMFPVDPLKRRTA